MQTKLRGRQWAVVEGGMRAVYTIAGGAKRGHRRVMGFG